MNLKIIIDGIAGKVRATTLTGLDTALNGLVVAGDTVLQAFGKIQNQLSNKVSKTGAETIQGVKTFEDRVKVGLVEKTAQTSAVAVPGADNSVTFERKSIDGGFKVIELVNIDETGKETIFRTTKIQL